MNESRKLNKLVIDDTPYATRLTSGFLNRKKYIPKDVRKVYSIIPGLILDVFIKEGQTVNEGDELLILEAMKMKNAITSPVSGKIKSVNVKINESVPKGFLLVEFE